MSRRCKEFLDKGLMSPRKWQVDSRLLPAHLVAGLLEVLGLISSVPGL